MSHFIMVKLKGGRKRLVKTRPGPSRSRYLYGERRGVLYSTLSHDQPKEYDMFIHNETGRKVRLTEHGNDVTYEPWAGGHAKMLPSSEFFASHHEASREEIEDEEDNNPPSSGNDVAAKAADKAIDAQHAAEKAAAAAKDQAGVAEAHAKDSKEFLAAAKQAAEKIEAERKAAEKAAAKSGS